MSFFNWKATDWAGVDYMQLIPVPRLEAECEPETGQVLILLPRYGDPILSRLLQPRLPANKRFIRVPLEQRGAFLWSLMDGQRSVADLAQAYGREFPEDKEDVPTRVSMYLHAMYDNKFISYVNGPS